MPRLQLLSGSYSAASLTANAQRSVNLFPEVNPEQTDPESAVTHYPRPGLTPLGSPPNVGRGRGLYAATNGNLFAVVNQSVYYVTPAWQFLLLGQMAAPLSTPVYMADNGISLIAVDGSPTASLVNLANNAFSAYGDPNYQASNRVAFLDYFLVFNQAGSPNWFCTRANSTVIDNLSFGTKTAYPDNVVGVLPSSRFAWVFGPRKSEIWANAGAVPFPFQIVSGNIVEYGSAALYSMAASDSFVYWLTQNPEGGLMVAKGSSGGGATRITTSAIEEAFLQYENPSDAIGVCYTLRGHAYYMLHFQTDDRTWVWDEAAQQWHEEAYYDTNGVQHRTKDVFQAYAYGKNVCLDWATGQLYQRDESNFSDNGVPIVFIKSMPHILDKEDYSRLTLWRVIADMECGNGPGFPTPTVLSPWSLGFNSGFGPKLLVEPPRVTLRVSRDRGFSFVSAGDIPMGSQGQYVTRPTWKRLGVAADFVLELSWAGPMKSALNSVFAIVEPHEADA